MRVKGWYEGGGVALEVVSDRGVEYTATVNLDEHQLPKGEVWLKNWGGQEGTPEALEAAGAVRLTGQVMQTGFCSAQHAKLLFEVSEEEDVLAAHRRDGGKLAQGRPEVAEFLREMLDGELRKEDSDV